MLRRPTLTLISFGFPLLLISFACLSASLACSKMWICFFSYPIPKPSIQSQFLPGTQISAIRGPLKFPYAIRNNFSTHLLCFNISKMTVINPWVMSRAFFQTTVSFMTLKVLDNLLPISFKLLASLMLASGTNHASNTAHISPMGNGVLLWEVSLELTFFKGWRFFQSLF